MRDPTATRRPRRLKMKDLERATGVGREAIRFYIREGLLPEPERPGRNVAFYDDAFVERIRFIKALQHKRYLPLHVIKSIVAGQAAPSPREVEALLQLDGKLFPQLTAVPDAPSERLSALATRTKIPVREVRALAAADAIEIDTRDGDHWVDRPGIRLVELWAEFRAAGFTPARGFTPGQIRLYVDLVKWLAREELRLFTRGIAGRVDGDAAARMAERGIEVGNQIIGLLRRQTLLRFVAQGNVPAAPADGSREDAASLP